MTHSDRDGSESPEFATGGPVRGPQYIIVNAGCLSGWAPLGTDDKGRSLGFTTTTTAPAGLPLHESADRDAGNVPSDRVRAYAEALHREHPDARMSCPGCRRQARAVMAVADRGQAELRAENERLRALRCADCATGEPHACATLALGEVTAERDHWRAVALAAESHKATLQEHVAKAEATIARVEALHARKHQCIGGCVYSETDPCPTIIALRGPEPTGDGA